MTARDLFLMQHAAVHGSAVRGRGGPTLADRAFANIPDARLRLRPAPGQNSLAWILWHIARAEDALVNLVLLAQPQVLDGGWVERMAVTRRDIGTGMTAEEVAALSEAADLAALREYRDAVGRRTRELVEAMPEDGWTGRVEAADVERAVAAGAFGGKAAPLAGYFTGWPRAAVLGGLAVIHSAEHIGEAFTVQSLGGFGPSA